MAMRSSPPSDTIAALATPPGRGGIGIIRLSGPRAPAIARRVCQRELRPRRAHYCGFHARERGGELIDSGIALLFPAPQSFTGEDVVELQGHGGPVVMDLLLRRCIELGARHARPGEFSERAFLNHKIDLTRAEAVADLINSGTESAARSASRSLQGEFARTLERLSELLVELRVHVESAVDFPEEDIDFLSEGRVAEKLAGLLAQFDSVARTARLGQLLSEGLRLVIAGRPNVGKSSLLNALSGQPTAIVTAIEGTTRDVLRAQIQIDGLPLHVVDTAGLRAGGDAIEREGMRRAWLEIESADHLLLVSDSAGPGEDDEVLGEAARRAPTGASLTSVRNKCDLTGQAPSIEINARRTLLHLSAKTGAGIGLLRQRLKDSAGFASPESGQFSARRRHLDALSAARKALVAGQRQLATGGAGELLAEDLRLAQQHLGEITGECGSEDLLREIFSSFCVGK